MDLRPRLCHRVRYRWVRLAGSRVRHRRLRGVVGTVAISDPAPRSGPGRAGARRGALGPPCERAHRRQASLVARREAHGPPPVLLPELEADGASEVDEFLLAEVAMEPRPELIARAIRVVRDRVCP